MIQRLKCFLGLHKYIYTEPVYRNYTEERLGITLRPATRVCQCCGKSQAQEIHCLGLNPPEYCKFWYNR